MKIGIIGSASVAQVLGKKFLELGHEVMLSSRDITKEKDFGERGKLPSAKKWASENVALGKKAFAGSFKDAAKFGELLVNCTTGAHSLEALRSAGKENFKGKILIDLANPLDFSKGMPPTLSICNTTSLGEEIQTQFPEAKVVKTLNTVTAELMVNPGMLKGSHDLFVCGNNNEAKKWVKAELLTKWLGWKMVLDLGDIKAARGLEMYLPLWLQLFGSLGTPYLNIHIETQIVKK